MIKTCGIVILAVKPYMLKDLLEYLGPHITEDTLVISVCAGVEISKMIGFMNGGEYVCG